MTPDMTRRQALGAVGLGGAAILAGGKLAVDGTTADEALAAGSCVVTANKEEGPYYVAETGLSRSDITSDRDGTNTQTGVPMTLTLQVFDFDSDCAALSGVQVDVWQASPLGKYSGETSEGTSGHQWLRGNQVTAADGTVTFKSLFPGYYSGRATHIHVRATNGTKIFETQLFFDETQTAAVNQTSPYSSNTNGTRTKNTADRVFTASPGGTTVLVTLTGSVTDGFTGELSVGLTAASYSGSGGGGTPTATATATATATPTATATTTPTETDTSVSGKVSSAEVHRGANGRRSVTVDIHPRETVSVVATLTRDGKKIAQKLGELGRAATPTSSRSPRPPRGARPSSPSSYKTAAATRRPPPASCTSRRRSPSSPG